MTNKKLLGATALQTGALILLAGATPAIAATGSGQAARQPIDQTVTTPAPAGQVDKGIVITGSRIRLRNLQSMEPTTTLNFNDAREQNFTNVADALNELPQIRGSVTPAGSQGSFGQGTNFINNYGLGSNRTLTLINGRRFVTSNPATNFSNASPGTQVDLNVVPDILVDHIDIVSVGGAPVYGSDAISGVVNVILRSKFNGLELQGVSGITEEGDNFRYNVSGLWGHNFLNDRLNLTFAVSHDNVNGVLYNDREFLRENIGNVVNPTSAQAAASRAPGITNLNDGRLNTSIGYNNSTSDGFPGTVLARDVGIPLLTGGGVITATNLACNATNRNVNPASCFGLYSPAALFFDNQGNLQPLGQGVWSGSNTSAALVGPEVFKFNDFSQITSDLRRTSVNGFATFAITPDIDFFFEGTHYQSQANELVQQPTFNSNLFSGTSGPLTFMTTSPFLTASARQTLQSRGVTLFQISRDSTDLADLTGYNRTRINRAVGGFRGNFKAFGRDMNFETSLNYGKAKVNEYGQDVNAQHFVNAVNVTTDSSGQIVCTTAQTRTGGFASGGLTPIADPNCVPFNPLGQGVSSAAARAYIIANTLTVTEQSLFVGNANVGGSVFDLWGGPVAFNLGYEHREEKANFTPDPFQQKGLGRSVAIAPVSGKYTLNEEFGELVLPIVSPDNHVPLVSRLQAFGRARHVESSINGSFWSTAYGGVWAPVRDIEFRGNKTRSFRHPALTELFLPIVSAFNTVPDLCQPATINSGPAPAVRAANCAAFLKAFPNATPDPAGTATVPILTGGNPHLQNEQANSWTVGVILRPHWIPRLSMTADYVNITLNDPISSLSTANVASACFDNTVFDTSDVLHANPFCSLIKRDPTTGRVVNDPATPAVQVGFVNGQQIKYQGIQGTVNYDFPLHIGTAFHGRLGIGGDWLYTLYRLNNITGVAPTSSQGVIGDPIFAGQLRVRYTQNNCGINTTVDYTGRQLFSRLNRQPGVAGSGTDAREIDHLEDNAIVGLGVFVDPTPHLRVTGSIQNLFNYQGERYQGVLIPASYVDLLGRRFAISARMKF
jgi:outer membrane receptor protein involved in Fe transport